MFAVHATAVALPWLVRRHRAGELGEALARFGPPLFALGGLALGLAAPWSAELAALVFGPDYAAAGPSLGWLLAATAAVYAGAPLLTALVATGAARAVLVVAAGALAVNLVGNAWLVPSRGGAGAAMATLAPELAVALAAAALLARAPGFRFVRPLAWLLGPATFVLGLTLGRLLH
jgi:O-antigen/teichoic acid export membrane protein